MDNFYDKVVSSFSKLKKKPKSYSKLNEQLAEDIKKCMKDIYDFSNTMHDVDPNSNVLPELIVEGFDAEQIWQEVELKNVLLLDQSTLKINKLLMQKHDLVPKTLDTVAIPQQSVEIMETNDDDATDNISNNDEEDKGEDSEDGGIDEAEQFEDDDNHDEDIDMNDDDDNHDEDIDMNDDDDEEDDESDTENVGEFIFGPEKTPSDTFFEEDTMYSDAEGVEGEQDNEVYSDAEEIREMEENAVKEKPWQMKGEVTSKDRPEYSLLEHTLEIDLSKKPAPVITEATTLKLEAIIKQRIKDKAFDSVERKAKPVETPLEYKKKLVLDQEKSKLSLAQIYENQYLNQEQSLNPNNEKQEEEPELHKEIKGMMSKLFAKLDALSNYHFTAKPSAPELKVVSNLPAVLMEDAVPLTTSDATLLAPEEVMGKPKGDVLGKSERSLADKKRQRRKKKKKQKVHAMEQQKSKPVLSGANIIKIKENPKAKKLKKTNDKVNETTGKSIRSSTAFFNQLEDDINTHKHDRVKKKRKNQEQFDAKRMKL